MLDLENSNLRPYYGLNTGKFFLGVLILLIGLVYLAQGLGFLSLNIGYIFQHFWSILLIFVGLSMFSRRSRVMTYFGFIIAFLVLATIFYSTADDSAISQLKRFEKIEVVQSPDAKEVEVKIDAQTAALRVEGGGEKLLSGTFQSPFMNLKTRSQVVGGRQEIVLDTRDAGGQFGWQYLGKNIGNFYLKLGTSTPTDLEVNSAAADINVDLTKFPAKKVKIASAASNVMITLGQKEPETWISVESKASAVTLRVPPSLGVRINFTSKISSKTLPGFHQVGNSSYESDNFSQSTRRAYVNLNSPLTSLDVVWKQ